MTPERWQEIKSVLAQALELPAGDRASFVARVAADDAELRHEVETLLVAAEGADSLPSTRAAIASAAEQSALEAALGQQYQIVRSLGRGGMGAVYLARERALERFVAIKVLRPDLASAPEARERFRREARIAAQLSHPGILPLHTFGEVGGLWYFVMGYVRGISLAERLRVEGRLPQEEAVRILAELSDALECAHRSGVVHRDIKPANILLDADTGHAMLADFGVSKLQGAADELTITGMIVGTPNYMSPEQAAGASDVDERSDIYSLGAVAYTMLAGREPFAGVPAEDLVRRRITHDPEPLSRAAPHVERPLARVVMRALARDRTARWSTAAELKRALLESAAAEAMVLPETLRDLPTFGPYALIWAISWGTLAVREASRPLNRALLLLVALVVPIGFALHIMNAGRHGLRIPELARVAFWPPEWWGMWWPKMLRRPTDLWSRLPLPARIARIALSIFLVAVPGLILFRPWFETGDGNLSATFLAAELWLLGGTAVVVLLCLLWGRNRELTMAETMRVLFGATLASRGWSDGRVSRVLVPARQGVRPPERESAGDHVRAIAELAGSVPDVGHEAVTATRKLADCIARCEREIASLDATASAAEMDRLAAQLATMSDASHAELRGLVQRQLEVLRGMRDRAESLSRERTRHLTLLHGLWTQMSELHAAAIGGAPSAATVSSVRSLIAEIGDCEALPAESAHG